MRLDVYLYKSGIVPSRQKGKEYIKEGQVMIGNQIITKPSTEYRGESVKLMIDHQYVSRGAYKLLKGLEAGKISINGKVCMDVGASTGGFSEVLLEKNAYKVYAIDVGDNQLSKKIRTNPKIISLEKTDIRYLTLDMIGEKIDFFCVDVSFISLEKILPHMKKFLNSRAEYVVLIKPQFELGKGLLSKSGVVKHEKHRKFVLDKISKLFISERYCVEGIVESPILGGSGNLEYLIYGFIKK